MKPFDEKFADNVRKVFDTWHEPVDEQAWLDMKNRLSKFEKKSFFLLVPVYMKFAAAAVVLLVASVSFWLLLQPSGVRENQLSLNKEVSHSAEIIPEINQSQIDNYTLIPGKPSLQTESLLSEQDQSLSAHPKSEIKPVVETNQNITIASGSNLEDMSTSSNPEIQGNIVVVSDDIETIADDITVESQDHTELAESLVIPIITAPDEAQIIANNLALMENHERNHVSKPGIEFSAGSMKTYSTAEIAGGMGYSAGITGNWPLSDRISIGGGGILVYNQFSLNEPYAATRSNSEFINAPNVELSGDYNIIGQKTYTDVKYMAIDIPVNFRYRISDIAKGKLYISAGLSSLLYLQQNYTQNSDVTAFYTRNDAYGNQYLDSEKAKVSSTTEYDAFRRLDLGRLLNLSLGYMINRDKNSLLIEPFIKYPLGDVTSMNLQIGMAGISLRYHFAKP